MQLLAEKQRLRQGSFVIQEDAEAAQLDESAVDDSFLLMKFWRLDDFGARALADGRDIEQQMELSVDETTITRFPRSVFILGRSGDSYSALLNGTLLDLHLLTYVLLF